MPCGCKVPIENYPESADWGPLFWKILHGLAEYSGKQTDLNLQKDELNKWKHLFTKLQNCIPCDICRDHYNRWIINHPTNEIESLPYNQVGNWIRDWFWNLHNEINEGNDKPLFDKSALSVTYKNVNITATWKALEPVMKRAMILNGVTLLSWKSWLGYVRMLQGIYGI